MPLVGKEEVVRTRIEILWHETQVVTINTYLIIKDRYNKKRDFFFWVSENIFISFGGARCNFLSSLYIYLSHIKYC